MVVQLEASTVLWSDQVLVSSKVVLWVEVLVNALVPKSVIRRDVSVIVLVGYSVFRLVFLWVAKTGAQLSCIEM